MNVHRGMISTLSLLGGMAFLLSGPGGSEEGEKAGVALDGSGLRSRFNLQSLGPIPYPPDNPPRQERIALGRLLFFDPILSGEKDVACGTCHHPDFAFADRRQFGAGSSGEGLGPDRMVSHSALTGLAVDLEPRNTPTIFNAAYNFDEAGRPSAKGLQFWDGRAMGLEEQALKPIASRSEMRGDAYPGDDLQAEGIAPYRVLARLKSIREYVRRFEAAFPEEAARLSPSTRADIINASTFSRALAAYQRELVTRNSPYDRFVNGDDEALNSVQKRGLEIFFTKARCAECHNGPMFSDFSFVVQGVPHEGVGKKVIPGDDAGREEHTKNRTDRYAFRTPTLRNVELTPPYMHNGAFETLHEVVRFYNNGARPRHPETAASSIDPVLLKPLNLTGDEMSWLVEFMKSLTDRGTALPPFLLTVPEAVPSGLPPVFGQKASK